MARRSQKIDRYIDLGLLNPRVKTFKIENNFVLTDGYGNGFKDRIDSLEGIEKLVDVSELVLSNVNGIGRLDLLASDNLKQSVKSLVLDWADLKNLYLFRNYREVEKLIIHSGGISDFSAFRHPLGKKLKFLAFTRLNPAVDLSDLAFLEALEKVHLHSMHVNLAYLQRENQGLPGVLDIIPPKGIREIVTSVPDEALMSFPDLERLGITIWNDFTDFVNYSRLARSVRYFTFGTGKYDSLAERTVYNIDRMRKMREEDSKRNAVRPRINLVGRIKKWECVEELDISVSNEANIYDILECKFVVDGKLKKLSLPDSINWGNIKNGNAAFKLRQMGVDVVSDQKDFRYTPEDIETKVPAAIYFICGPSGAGKSTLVRYLRDELGLPEVPSFTTRPYRNIEEKKKGSLVSVTDAEFDWLRRNGRLAMVRSRGNIRYALDYDFYRQAVKDGGKYLYDAGHIDPSLQFRDGHPNVQVILRVPPIERVVGGLISRTAGLRREYHQLTSMGEDASHIEKNIIDAQARMAISPDEAKRYASYSMVVGVNVIGESDYDVANQKVKEVVCGGR